MIFRLTQKMAKKIKRSPKVSYPPAANPYIDWSAHLFTAERAQYVIITNTTSLYSMILHGRGLTDSSRFSEYTLEFMADYIGQDGFEFQFRRFIAAEAAHATICKLTDRHVIGSINNLVYMAKFYLRERQSAPFEASQLINDVPMSYINYCSPKEAFVKMKPVSQDALMATNDAIYETLYRIYNKHRRRYRENAYDSQQMCLMWSTNDPPDEIIGTEPLGDMEAALGIRIDEDEALELYDMSLQEAAREISRMKKDKKRPQ